MLGILSHHTHVSSHHMYTLNVMQFFLQLYFNKPEKNPQIYYVISVSESARKKTEQPQ